MAFKTVMLKNSKNSDLEELGGGATHLIGNKTRDVIHVCMNHESISTFNFFTLSKVVPHELRSTTHRVLCFRIHQYCLSVWMCVHLLDI